MSKTSKKNNTNTKSIEDRYKKLKDQHEHILKRPGMYIGSVKKETIEMWVYNEDREEADPELVLKKISYVPGLYKIFDEILVNARDHVVRCIEEKREPCTIIKVYIDQDTGKITVWNNGAGIPVVEHKEHKILIPSMIFGELLTSGNYDDDEKRKVGGTNGLGAKLTNIYSTEFEVETLDAETNKKFYQKFTNNMYKKEKPKVTSGGGKKSYTKISFIPDFEKFGIEGLTKNIAALFKKRVYDIAMTSNAKVYFNDKIIAANSFAKYVDLYFPEGSEHKKVLDISDENWKVCVVYDPTDKLEHQTISFVNGICTSRGGTHVDHVANQIVKKIQTNVSKKVKGLTIKPNMIKENLIFFVDAVIINPEFDTQTKELLKTKVADFGSSYSAPETFLKKIIGTGVVDQIVANAQAKAEANLAKSGKGKNLNYEKLYDAHKAKLKKGECTLILTEGDSAKTFAVAGTNVIGRDYYGVFPLRGKLLNVRDESPTKIAANEEIQAITKIVGLEHKKVYDSLDGLRYGSIMILTDQDVDGSHIKGLIMNFIHHYWPSLAKYEGFITSFATPLLKATKKGKKKNPEIVAFYSMQEFDEWKKENDVSKWDLHYYKGLGTSDAKEARECFEDFEDKLITYYWQTKLEEKEKKEEEKNKKNKKKKESSEFIDEESDLVSEIYKPKFKDVSEDAITLAFAKKREDDRKKWLNTYDPKIYIDSTDKKISYYDFIHKELIAFSVYDTARSIPNIMDGFKPGQRKVFYGSVKKNIYKGKVKVAQLSGYISEHTHYHHGEQSLNETIIKMAQNYVGSNNLNLLIPHGQFGSRLCGGKDAASPRYIFTQLSDISKKIFVDYDFDILEHQTEDGDVIEPTFYAPIIPMVLVNGTDGIGTGYSTCVEPCNPRDIIANLKRIIAGEKPKVMKPWFRHFSGTIEKIDHNKYVSRAKYDIIGEDTIHITDLPIGIWTDNYKAFLANLVDQGAQQKAQTKREAKAKQTAKNTKGAKGKGRGGSKNSKFLAKKSQKSSTARVAKKNRIGADIKNYKEDCTDVKVSVTIVFQPGKLKQHIKNGTLEKGLKLVTPINLTNMHLFDEHGKIRKYESYGAILKNFSKVRLDLYQKRKDYLLGKWKKEMDILKWKLKFVEGVISDKIIVFKKKTEEIIKQLEDLKFPKLSNDDDDDNTNEGNDGESKTKNKTKNPYKYLTSMTIIRFSKDEVEKLRKEIENKKEEIETLENKTPSQIWEEELDELLETYDVWEAECDTAFDELMIQKKGSNGKRKRRAPKKSSKQDVEV
ncbi:mg403 protein [Tupanvirus deep ocean]|uniref:Mg403 protein n=2 Tax=Tupanvirus TaxID=2094720 RepID=A0AC62A948_9VIRU|nr:mg403 protein [Tupanvirus deep ocean]QKU34197.1 mg403 protein [Tupanvirus deep ocean]